MKEEWRNAVGYEGLYMVSSFGRVKSLDRVVCGINGNRFLKGKDKIIGHYKNGYAKVMLCKDGVKKTLKPHRLVAEAFLPNPSNKPCVNHIDGNPSNNNVSNLEWCTYSENTRHSFDVLKRGYDDTFCSMYGSESSRSKKIVAYTEGNLLLGVFGCIKDAAESAGVDRASISRVINGHASKSCGIIWKTLG